MNEKHILFMCKHNKFRSKVAEAAFKKWNKNPDLKAKSAGVVASDFFNEKTVAACREIGIYLRGKPQGLSMKLLKWQDILIIVADNVPPSLFNQKKYGKKLVAWRIHDTSEIHQAGDKEKIQKIAKIIERRVKRLLGGWKRR